MLTALLIAIGASPAFDAGDLSRYSSPNEKIGYTQNLGQWDKKVRFMARYGGADVWVTGSGITYAFRKPVKTQKIDKKHPLDLRKSIAKSEGYAVGIEFLGATGKGKAVGIEQQRKMNGYYKGRDRSKWVQAAPNFDAAMVKDLYPGIDLVSYMDRQSRPRYDLIVHPGADAAQIKMRYNGAQNLHVDEKGQVVYNTPLGKVTELQQIAIQQSANKNAPYRFMAKQELGKDGTVSFNVDGYRKDRALVIDPLIYSTFIGGNDEDSAVDIALGSDDTNYIVGYTYSTDYPATGAFGPGRDGIITSVAADGSSIGWSIIFGGNGNDHFQSVALDASGDVYLAGNTSSTDLPVTDSSGPEGGKDGYAAKFDGGTGALVYATYIGGSGDDFLSAIAVDGTKAVVFGDSDSTDLTASAGAYKATPSGADFLVAKLSNDGATREILTFVGGTDDEVAGLGVALDGDGKFYFAGSTASSDFPMAGTPFENIFEGSSEGVIGVLSADGTSLWNSTFLGGDDQDDIYTMMLDGSNVVVCGVSTSSDFYVSPGAGPYDSTGFVSVLSDDLSACSWSTFIGEDGIFYPFCLAKTGSEIVVGGYGTDILTTTATAVQSDFGGFIDGILVKIEPGTAAPTYASYLGGNDLDAILGVAVTSTGDLRTTGTTASTDFPTLDSIQSFAGVEDATLSSISTSAPSDLFITSNRGPSPHIAGGVGLTMQITVTLPNTDGGDVTLTSPSPSIFKVNGGASDTITVSSGDSEAIFTVTAFGSVATTTDVPLGVTTTNTAGDGEIVAHAEPFVQAVNTEFSSLFGSRRMLAEVEVYEPPAVRTAVTISDNSPNVRATTTAYVEAGCGCTDFFTIYTFPVAVDETVTITGTLGASSASTSFDLKTPMIASLKANAPTIQAGSYSYITVRFQGPVLGTKVINVTSSDPAKFPSVQVTVFDGATEGYTVAYSNAFSGSSISTVTLTATYGAQTISGRLRIIPIGVSSFSVGRTNVAEGNSVPVRVDLLAPAIGDTVINITSALPALVPSTTVTVLDGESYVDTTIPSSITDMKLAKTVRLTASYGTSAKGAGVVLNPAVLSVTGNPTTLTGGNDSTGEVVLFEPLEYDLTLNVGAASASVHLDSPTLFLASGSNGDTFTIHTVHRSTVKTAKITVSKGTWSKGITLTINP